MDSDADMSDVDNIDDNRNEELETEDVLCMLCSLEHSVEQDLMLLCDGCDLAVHQRCYGVGRVPEGDWFCSRCRTDGLGLGAVVL